MGNNIPKNNRIDQTAADQHWIDGFTKHASTITNVVVGGVSMPTKDIIALLQSRIDSTKGVATTRATWQTAVQADRALRDKTKTTVSALRQTLLAFFVGQLDTLADFGLSARQKHVATPAAKLAAAAKAKATRAARHTLGSKQKAVIKGTVTPTAPATAAPSAPTPSPTQAVNPPTVPVTATPQPVNPVATPIAAAPTPVTPAPVLTAPTTPPATPATPQAPTHSA